MKKKTLDIVPQNMQVHLICSEHIDFVLKVMLACCAWIICKLYPSITHLKAFARSHAINAINEINKCRKLCTILFSLCLTFTFCLNICLAYFFLFEYDLDWSSTHPSSTRTGFEPMTSRPWTVHFMSLRRIVSTTGPSETTISSVLFLMSSNRLRIRMPKMINFSYFVSFTNWTSHVTLTKECQSSLFW